MTGSEGVLLATATEEIDASTVNFTFCDKGYNNATAKAVCIKLGYSDGQYGSNPQNFEYVSE